MPSETLTKYRLVQIIVTLAILLIAFIWRTATYGDVVTMNCIPEPKCSLIVNEIPITITKSKGIHDGYIVYPINKEWTIKPKGKTIRNGDAWLVTNSATEIQIIELGIKIQLLQTK